MGEERARPRIAIVGPVFPYRAVIPYCTTRLAAEMARTCDVTILSFKRQYPRWFYPGGDDIDESLRPLTPAGARFVLDIINPLTWLRAARMLRRERPDAVIFVWWIWVWTLPYRTLMALLPRRTRVILQCHNIGEKEPAWWKRALANLVLRRGDVLVVHAKSEAEEAARRIGERRAASSERVVQTFLPVLEVGTAAPSREQAKKELKLNGNVALLFGHVRPYKGLDIALHAWPQLKADVTLLVAGEPWWKVNYPPQRNVRFDFRFIPDSEVATYFAAADVVLAPYRVATQSGVALTGFHFGRPVIASSVGGLPDIIDGRNGILVPPEDPAALARAIDEFFLQRDRAAMERAAADSAKRYSWAEYGAIMSRLVTRA
jgi:glycosyltransferase involved in cell wall biosynthesis